MAKILHIIASPRGEDSRTLRISRAFLEDLKKKDRDTRVDELDLFDEELPRFGAERARDKYALMAGGGVKEQSQREWGGVERHIERFLSADLILISTPMWNFGIPYVLKHYIDVIVQPGYLFKYGANGPEGLARGKRMVVISSRGGVYAKGTPTHAFDQLEPYLRTVFGFVGVSDISFVNAEGMDISGPEDRERIIERAIARARGLSTERAPEPVVSG
ncbi:FMN-dependent NADH-azoreductase [Elusimicrobiota bacterium]